MWLLDAAGNQLKREALFPSALPCYWSFFKPLPEPSGHNAMPSALLEQDCGTKCLSVVPSSLTHPRILWLCHAELGSHSHTARAQAGNRSTTRLGCSGPAQRCRNLKPMVNSEEANWGTDGGFQQQPMVVIQSYHFYKENDTFSMILWLKIPVWLWFLEPNADSWIPVPSCAPGDPAHGQGKMHPNLCVSALIPASAAAILLILSSLTHSWIPGIPSSWLSRCHASQRTAPGQTQL